MTKEYSEKRVERDGAERREWLHEVGALELLQLYYCIQDKYIFKKVFCE